MSTRSDAEDDDPPAPSGLGSAAVTPEEGPGRMDQYAAVLWVPDCEQRHGWREYYVKRPPKPGARWAGLVRTP